MTLSEADTRAKMIDPALHARGWTEDLIRREETAGAVEIMDGKPVRRARGRTDYTLRVRVAVPDFLTTWLNGRPGREQLDTRLKQIVGQATINRSDLCSLQIPLPPIEEQRQFLGRLDIFGRAEADVKAATGEQVRALGAGSFEGCFPKRQPLLSIF